MADKNTQNSNQTTGKGGANPPQTKPPVPVYAAFNPTVKTRTSTAGTPAMAVKIPAASMGTSATSATQVIQDDQAAKMATLKTQTKFDIPEQVKEKYADLIHLVLETESMNDEERQYWFHILPIMTPEQVEKFRKILTNEKEQLAKLDHEYETEIKRLNEKHLLEWQEMKTREKRTELQKKETVHEKEEKTQEEELLKKIDET